MWLESLQNMFFTLGVLENLNFEEDNVNNFK